jgi:hypothetical protein
MKKKSQEKKYAVISGICFLLYGIILFLIFYLVLKAYSSGMDSLNDVPFDSISGWFILFALVAYLLLGVLAAVAPAGMFYSCFYIVIGILVLLRKKGLFLAIVSSLFAGIQLYSWTQLSDSLTAAASNFPISITGTILFAVFAVILGVRKLSSMKWFVQKFWMLPAIMKIAAPVVSMLESTILQNADAATYSSYSSFLPIRLLQLMIVFLAYFFGSLWMKKEAQAGSEEMAVVPDPAVSPDDSASGKQEDTF